MKVIVEKRKGKKDVNVYRAMQKKCVGKYGREYGGQEQTSLG